MDRTSKLYRLSAELTMLKSDIHDFETLRPNPKEWTKQEATHYDALINRHNDIRAKIAELGVTRRPPRKHSV